MKLPPPFQLQLRTLTPIHIGNGEALHSIDYVVMNGKFYRLSQNKFIEFLKQFGPDAVEKFADWAVETANVIDRLEFERKKKGRDFGRDKNQMLSQRKREYNYLNFAENQLQQRDAFAQFLNKESTGLAIGNLKEAKQQIREHIKTGTGKAYLPGSSIKGAIRSALLYHVMNHHLPKDKIQGVIERAIDQYRREKRKAEDQRRRFNPEKHKERFAKELEQIAFYCSLTDDRGREKKDDEKMDLLKLLSVSDDLLPGRAMTLENLDIYLVEKIFDRRTKKSEFISGHQRQAPAVEAIQAEEEFSVELDFNIDFLLEMKRFWEKVDGDFIKAKAPKEQYWIGIRKMVKSIFNIDLVELTEENKAEYKTKVLNHIQQCIHNFSQRHLEFDKRWLSNFVEDDKSKNYTGKIQTGFDNVLDHRGGPLLHVGYASGFGAITELFYFIDELRPFYKEVMEIFGIGDHPLAGKRRKPGEKYVANPDKFPKSKRLVTRPNEITPMGWIEITNGIKVDYPKSEAEQKSDNFEPQYPTKKIKNGVVVDAQITKTGKPSLLQLFLGEDNHPEVELSYGPRGFEEDKLGKYVKVEITNVSKKGQVMNVRFKGFY